MNARDAARFVLQRGYPPQEVYSAASEPLGSEVIRESLTRYLFNSSGEIASDFSGRKQTDFRDDRLAAIFRVFVCLNDETWRLETRPVNLFRRRWPNRKCLSG